MNFTRAEESHSAFIWDASQSGMITVSAPVLTMSRLNTPLYEDCYLENWVLKSFGKQRSETCVVKFYQVAGFKTSFP